MSEPTVSVIVPAYNAAGYLQAAVESALAQTRRDLEVIVVDDGSTDGTPDVLERCRALDPARVRIVRQANAGPSRARNHAIRVARGRLLALLDADDEWMPTFLEEQLGILESRPDVAVVTTNALNRGGACDGQPYGPWPDPRPDPDLSSILADETSVFVMTVFRRQVVEAIGGFDESLRTNEDYDFWIRAAMAGFRFARNARPLGYYRRSEGSLSASEIRMLSGIARVYRKALDAAEPGTAAHTIAEQQIERFEAELLRAEARAALAGRDAAGAADAVDRLRARTGGLTLAIAAQALRLAPRATVWAYAARRRRRAARHRTRNVATTGR
jgi:glycosyltransferase involved in cell wall biosynthesis